MTAPKNEIVPVDYQNPDASSELKLSLVVVSNTSDEVIQKNITENSANYHEWACLEPVNDKPIVIIGGGDSINDHINDIQILQSKGAIVYALNGASRWARAYGIEVDYQVIIDAKEETADLVDLGANDHLFASQCNPKTFQKVAQPKLWHLASENIEQLMPSDRVKKGGYVLVGGDSTAGACAMCLAYTQGHRELHLFGYDSSHRAGKSHGYEQRINDAMPFTQVKWAGKEYQVSIAMKRQALRFPINARALESLGCDIKVYGEGLLQTVYNTDFSELSEKEKYQTMWLNDAYREVSPGENIADIYMNQFRPRGDIIDFGCGTGRSSIKFSERGLRPLLIDFADNSRDEEALNLPFLEWDLSEPIPAKAFNGYCTDVMEHIPTKDVRKVIKNIMRCCKRVFFQISTIEDVFGESIGEPLHLTVKPHEWWMGVFKSMGYKVKFDHDDEIASIFYVSH